MNLLNILKGTTLIQYLTLGYAVLYILFILAAFIGVVLTSLNAEEMGVLLLFVLFIFGVLLSWYNGIITGVLFLIWNVGMWILELFLVEKDGGFGIIMGIPLIVLGVFFILQGIKKNKGTLIKSDVQWKIVLQILTITYTILYTIVIINDLTGNLEIDFLNTPGIILLSLILVYIIGFILSWKKELFAGIMFIIWYAGVYYIFKTNSEIGDSGPWIVAGFVVLIQGIFYINYWLKIKQSKLKIKYTL